MILAAGLTPAWQHILQFDTLQAGEVNRARHTWHGASGKVVNVALAAHRLGAPTRIVTLVGGLTGEAIRRELTGLGIEGQWVSTVAATRVCTTLIESATGTVTELVEESPAATDDELAALADAFRAAAKGVSVVVLSGSLPRDTPPRYYRDLLDGVTAPVVLDVRGPELLAALPSRPLLVKPNREELARTVGGSVDDDATLRAGIDKLLSLGAQWVLVSAGGAAAWLVSRDVSYRVWPVERPVVNPIGSGDCLAAGVAYGLHIGREVVEAVRWGMAAAAENLATHLPAQLDHTRVETLSSKIRVEQVPRVSQDGS